MATGVRYSETDTGITKRSIADVIDMIDWTEAPLLRIFGFNSSNVSKFNLVNWPSTKVEIIDDTMPVWYTTLAEALDDSETEIDVTDGTLFRQGDVLATYDVLDTGFADVIEQMTVTSVSSNALTVVRGHGSTSATAADSGDYIKLETRTMPENSSYTTGYTTTTTQPYNYTQILSEAVSVSRTAKKMSMYGITDLMDYQVGKLFADGGSAGKLAQLLANTFYRGERVVRANGSTYGSMGGFTTFVTTSTASTDHVFDLSDAAITRADIHKVIRAIRSSGGKPTHLITGAWGMEKIEAMYEGNRTYTQDATLGGSEIMQIKTPHGQVKVVFDWMCPEDSYYFVNSEYVGWIPFDEFRCKDQVDETRDGYVDDVVGEYTFLVKNASSHGLITGASTST